MKQQILPLLNSGPPPGRELYSIAGGEIEIVSSWLDKQRAHAIYQTLKQKLPWDHPDIFIAGQYRKIPRLQYWVGDKEAAYTYSGVRFLPQPWTPLLSEIKDRLQSFLNVRFNSVLANYYRHGQDSMGWHSDNEPELGEQPVIASISLGAERLFKLRSVKANPFLQDDKLKPLKFSLRSGDLLVMSGDTQRYWQHSVPKTAKFCGGRVNLTFRYIHYALNI